MAMYNKECHGIEVPSLTAQFDNHTPNRTQSIMLGISVGDHKPMNGQFMLDPYGYPVGDAMRPDAVSEVSEDPDSSYYQSGDFETVKTEIKGIMRAWTPSEDVLMRLAIDVMAEILSETEPTSRESFAMECALRDAVMDIIYERGSL
ncbi:hypothetical protein AUP07_0407 [methanogenic archaeon mixed culture ISO4-G1]|nr:hypothetical protein AUP07_0407 [methanogenic archaeon mixed culture ISO4-G1]